jgi:ATP-dependent RNA helicase RhlE
MTFQDLKLISPLLANVRDAGYTVPTPIQEATIPLVLEGDDVLGCAQTGTGKTASFALPILQRLLQQPSRRPDARVIRALVLSPTRELAMQTWENFEQYGRGLPLRSCVVFGGVGQGAQAEALHQGADIVIACPGRLLDLMGQGLIRLDWVEIFVLDEADRMLDMGFIHDVRRVVRSLPDRRQTLLFSATMPPDVEKLALDLLTEPKNVKVDPVTSTVEAIDQCLYYVDKGNKKHLLAHLLQSEDLENALVFSRTRYGVDRIVRDLKKAGIDAAGIHGDKSQNARQTALKRFKSGECKVLVATDIAARGIDVAGLSHVINYDMPMEPEAYIHRIGRTGRAGRDGKAISFCCIDEVKQLNQVEKLIGKRLREEQSDWPMEITTPTPPKVREPRPAKINTAGQAVPPRKKISQPARIAQAHPARPAAARPAPSAGRRHSRRKPSAYGRPVQRTKR